MQCSVAKKGATLDSLFEGGLLGFIQTNSPTLARQRDDFGYIRILATLLRRLIFWDGAPSLYKRYQSKQIVFNNWYQSEVNLKISAIKFDIQKFDGIINFSRLG